MQIGKSYKYPNSNNIFKLKEINKERAVFECGHWCCTSVCEDLYDIEAGCYNWEKGFTILQKYLRLKLFKIL